VVLSGSGLQWGFSMDHLSPWKNVDTGCLLLQETVEVFKQNHVPLTGIGQWSENPLFTFQNVDSYLNHFI